MPEGDTVRRLADAISRRFAGERCQQTVTRDPRLVGIDFSGTVLLEADALGKHLLIRFDDGRTLHSHLRMTGSWTVGPVAVEPVWRRRVEMWMESGRLTALDVPILGVVQTAAEDAIVGHLGPDLCAANPPDLDEIESRLQRDRGRPLAGAMLDQRNVAGFGNLYAVELPFIVGVSPNQPIGSVDGLGQLIGLGAAMIRTNARLGPQNTTGRRLTTDDHWVYPTRDGPTRDGPTRDGPTRDGLNRERLNRERLKHERPKHEWPRGGRPCPICGTRLDGWTEQQSPWRRISVWCPSCQPPSVETRSVDIRRTRRLLSLHPARREAEFPAIIEP